MSLVDDDDDGDSDLKAATSCLLCKLAFQLT
jgi:hypothetical protein